MLPASEHKEEKCREAFAPGEFAREENNDAAIGMSKPTVASIKHRHLIIKSRVCVAQNPHFCIKPATV
jgi:hypothetical protein